MKYLINKYKEKEEFIRKMYDVLSNIEKYHNFYHFNFLDPLEQIIAVEILNRFPSLTYQFNPDNLSYERKQLVVNDDKFDIEVYRIEYNSKYNKIDHKDVLGSLMSVGLERNFFGDIFLNDKIIEFSVISKRIDLILNNFTSIKKTKIKPTKIDNFTFSPNFKEQEIITSSKRLDCLLSNIFDISRSKASDFIENGFVHLNYKIVEEKDYLCNNIPIVISLKKFGKVKITEELGITKNKKLILKVLYYQ